MPSRVCLVLIGDNEITAIFGHPKGARRQARMEILTIFLVLFVSQAIFESIASMMMGNGTINKNRSFVSNNWFFMFNDNSLSLWQIQVLSSLPFRALNSSICFWWRWLPPHEMHAHYCVWFHCGLVLLIAQRGRARTQTKPVSLNVRMYPVHLAVIRHRNRIWYNFRQMIR